MGGGGGGSGDGGCAQIIFIHENRGGSAEHATRATPTQTTVR
jgi:hypothetical protein